jgi:hypothetical protein
LYPTVTPFGSKDTFDAEGKKSNIGAACAATLEYSITTPNVMACFDFAYIISDSLPRDKNY